MPGDINTSSRMYRRLLLLHGALYTSAEFAPVIQLISTSRNPLTLDFAGHGSTPLPETPLSIEYFGLQTLARMDQEGVDVADIMGYSMGGYVGLWLALHHPDRVGRVATLATKLQWDPETAAREASMLDPEKIEAKVPAFAATLSDRHGPHHWKDLTRRVASMLLRLGDDPPLTLAAAPSIQAPVRLMVGDRDSMVSIEETVEFYRVLPNAQLAVLPATPHRLEKTRPDDIAGAVEWG